MARSSWQKRGPTRGKDQAGQRHKAHGNIRSAQRAPAGLPLALHTTSASPHEVSLVLDTLEQSLVDEWPQHLIGDKAYDSDSLDEQLAEQGVNMIAPHRTNRKPEHKTQDARPLR